MLKVIIVVYVREWFYICLGVFHRLATAQIVLSGLFFCLAVTVLHGFPTRHFKYCLNIIGYFSKAVIKERERLCLIFA